MSPGAGNPTGSSHILFVGFCDGLHLLQREAVLIKDERFACLAVAIRISMQTVVRTCTGLGKSQ